MCVQSYLQVSRVPLDSCPFSQRVSDLCVDGLKCVFVSDIKILSQSCHVHDMYLKRSTSRVVATQQTSCCQASVAARLSVKPLTPPSGAVENCTSVSTTRVVLEL